MAEDKDTTGRTIVDRFIDGLTLLRPYMPAEIDPMLTEAGNHFHAWRWDGKPLEVPEDVARQLVALGWYFNQDGAWATAMSG